MRIRLSIIGSLSLWWLVGTFATEACAQARASVDRAASSALFKQAHLMIAQATDAKPADPMYTTYVSENVQEVQALRQRYWPESDPNKKAKHPRTRWTGKPLSEDARDADQFTSEKHLHRFHVEQHARLCWATHGSGTVGMHGIPSELVPNSLAIAMMSAPKFVLRIGALALRLLSAYDPIMERHFQEARATSLVAHKLAYETYKQAHGMS